MQPAGAIAEGAEAEQGDIGAFMQQLIDDVMDEVVDGYNLSK